MADEDKAAAEKAIADKAAADAKAKGDAEAKAKADAEAKAKADADKMRPTPEEIEFVARAMDCDRLVDWESKPERGDNARALARQMILGFRAVGRVGEAKKAAKPSEVKTGA